jgi:hypothetical protein
MRWDHLLIRLPRNSKEDYPERTGIRVRTERYCHRSVRRLAPRNPAPPASPPLRGFGGEGGSRRLNRMEDSVKLTDTQLVLLSAASQRDDRALERPSKLTGGAAGKVITKLLTEGLIEEIQSRGSLPVWRRDEDGPRSLRITKKGLKCIRVEDEPVEEATGEAAKKPPARSASRRKPPKASASSRTRKGDKPPRILALPGRLRLISRSSLGALPASRISIQNFNADLFVRTPRHAAMTARRRFKRHIDIKIVWNLSRCIYRKARALFGLVHDNAFLHLLSLGPRKPPATAHSRTRIDTFILRFRNGLGVGHRYIPMPCRRDRVPTTAPND